jgi:hypothetical protein
VRIPARSVVEVVRKECVEEGSESKILFSKHLEVKVGCRLRRVSVVKLSRSFGGLLLRAHAESKEARTVEVFAGLP